MSVQKWQILVQAKAAAILQPMAYPGVYFIMGTSAKGKPEKIYYIRYRKNGKLIEEKAGRQFKDDMAPARAASKRARWIEGASHKKNL